MTEADLQRVEALFQTAADLPAGDRGPYLADACGGDAGLLARVEALLGRLENDALMLPPLPVSSLPITEGPGTVIGRYKLLQVIGEGGFGVVYMAEQQDPVIRKVALKIIKLGMETREVVARFEAERQALALMDHPNIARVLDGGATASGRPYFVMELVRGVAITEYCDQNDLGPRPRLELFEDVCHAIQHAHQKGVIHRDLKPSNVLVTMHDDRPIPKVIDFGVAKAMHTRLTEKTLFTQYQQFIGTPAYMSPEQAQMSALDVDTRTDIYALGVLLYELLTGSTPFDSKSLLDAGLLEVQRIIREDQPPRPSLRISTTGDAAVARQRGMDVSTLSRRLRGDLDWIVMKAMEKERGRRYATASALADDVRRHLNDEPVTAGPPGTAYRLRKFLSRNRAAVIMVSVVALALVGAIIGVTAGKLEADRNAELAQTQADHALEALDFLVSTLSLANPEVSLSPNITVQTLLDDTSGRVATAFAEQPWAEARVRSAIGRAYAALGQNDRAEPHLRRTVELVDTLLADAGRFEGDAGFDAGDHYATLWALTNVAFNLERGDAFAVAMQAREVGLAYVASDYPGVAAALHEFIRGVEAGTWSQAPRAMVGVPPLFDRAARIAEAVLPRGEPRWPIVADTFLVAGYEVWYTPHEPMSEHFFRQALAIQQRELKPDHPDIATTVGLLVGVLNKLGRSAEAERLMRGSVERLRRVHGGYTFPVAVAESMLGENLVHQGRYAEAEPLLRRSHELIVATVEKESNFMAVESFVRLIELYDGLGTPERATAYRDVIARTAAHEDATPIWEIARHAFDAEHAGLVESMDGIQAACGGVSYLVAPGRRRPDDFAPLLTRLVNELQTFPSTDRRRLAVARVLVGSANALNPDPTQPLRRAMALAALPTLRAWASDRPLDLADGLTVLATTTVDPDEARRYVEEAWDVMRGATPGSRWFTAATEVRVGREFLRHAMRPEAERLLRPAYEILLTQLGADHSETRLTRGLLHELYTDWNRPAEAAASAPRSMGD